MLLVSTPLFGCLVPMRLVLSSTLRDGHFALSSAIPLFLLPALPSSPSFPPHSRTPAPYLPLLRVSPPSPFRSSGVSLLSASPFSTPLRYPLPLSAAPFSHTRQPTFQSRHRFPYFVRLGRGPPSDSVLSLSLCSRFFSHGPCRASSFISARKLFTPLTLLYVANTILR